MKEIEKIENKIINDDGEFCEKMQNIYFLNIVNYRLTNSFLRFYSEILPLNIYVINEFSYFWVPNCIEY